MYCTHCGTRLAATDAYCPGCGTPVSGNDAVTAPPSAPPESSGVHPVHIPSYLAQAILATLFCCMPFGIVAIVYAAQVNGRLAAGDYGGARSASASARTWSWVAFGCGLAGMLLYGLIVLLGVAADR